MKLSLPPKIRASLYIFTSLASPLVEYLFAKHFIGRLEVGLWASEVAIVSAMAAFNINSEEK